VSTGRSDGSTSQLTNAIWVGSTYAPSTAVRASLKEGRKKKITTAKVQEKEGGKTQNVHREQILALANKKTFFHCEARLC
jgi:ribosomal protein L21